MWEETHGDLSLLGFVFLPFLFFPLSSHVSDVIVLCRLKIFRENEKSVAIQLAT